MTLPTLFVSTNLPFSFLLKHFRFRKVSDVMMVYCSPIDIHSKNVLDPQGIRFIYIYGA